MAGGMAGGSDRMQPSKRRVWEVAAPKSESLRDGSLQTGEPWSWQTPIRRERQPQNLLWAPREGPQAGAPAWGARPETPIMFSWAREEGKGGGSLS